MRLPRLFSLALLPLCLAACASEPRSSMSKVESDGFIHGPNGELFYLSDDCVGKNGSCSVAEHEAQQSPTRDDLKQQVMDIIAANPKIVVDAFEAYQRQRVAEAAKNAKEMVAQRHDDIYADPADMVIGDPKGDVTLIEWFDYSCPVCHAEEEAVSKLLADDPHVRVVLKPMAFLAPGSSIAAKAALAAKRQGDVAKFHHLLMTDKTPEGKLEVPRILELARQAGLDIKRLREDMDRPEIVGQMKKTTDLALALNVRSTPTLFVGDVFQKPGALPLDVLRQAVSEARKSG